ncbi:MAG: hypothetical protein OHK0022_34770 [Roseiflexaceae bacterium]
MNETYERLLESRLDTTEWLIHFTRNQGKIRARDILLNIIKEGALRPGQSIRKTRSTQEERSTIYGGEPVVCFTEQPLIYFIEYVKARRACKKKRRNILVLDSVVLGSEQVALSC